MLFVKTKLCERVSLAREANDWDSFFFFSLMDLTESIRKGSAIYDNPVLLHN